MAPRLMENTNPFPVPAFSITCGVGKLTVLRTASCSIFRGGDDVAVKGKSKGTILVADDNENISEPLGGLLRLQGFRVISGADGEDGFSEMFSKPVDLALLDVMMPGRTGL